MKEMIGQMYLEAKGGQLEEFAQFIGERTQVVVVQHQFAQTVVKLLIGIKKFGRCG